MSQPAFKHQPLADPAGQIRLIEVTSKPNKPLELFLRTYQIHQAPEYNAISYTWGENGFTEEIIIDGHLMTVTENCQYALMQVRDRHPSLPRKPVFIWIDSICINQGDNDEKSYQVAMMGDIFTKASKVLACVGPHQDNSQIIRNSLNSIKTLSPNLYYRAERGFSGPGTEDDYFLHQDFERFEELFLLQSQLSGREFYTQFRHAFSTFANQRYWRRLWIIQEVVASNRNNGQLETLCGSDSFSRSEMGICDFICRATYKESNMTAWGQEPASSEELGLYCCRFVLASHASVPIPAHMLLERSKPFGCARLEDKVFGVLPMIRWPEGIPPAQPVYEPSPISDLAQWFTSIVKSLRTDIWAVLNALELSHGHKLLRPLVETRMKSRSLPLGRGNYPPMSFKFKATFMAIFRNTCKGDSIIKVPVIGELLVLRRSAQVNEYTIIGQGLLLSNYEIPSCPSMVSIEDEFEESEAYWGSNFDSCCEIEAEPTEFIVLERQDRGIEGSRIEGKKLERLATKIYGTVKFID
ncbi:Heterokaryon incompatibility protein [Fusarium globosum]|uniref:Heterokaryon incompatibility protein n=1 Tax=Fusarium globosum TaxID=78864 RepID=A0A8H6DHA6_9HYPO|nr:Heterokaryon incompatibility protein [Fusarium globosum]